MIIQLRDRLGGHLAVVDIPFVSAPATLTGLVKQVRFLTGTQTVTVVEWTKNFERVVNNPPARVVYLEQEP